ncbi:DUF3558 family protein [Actinokineospora sp.]|uniref:DUF3558 family protein n=1 Tax=Actinokineospora sp. TaxID=1872133 RepID=UPI004037BBDC
MRLRPAVVAVSILALTACGSAVPGVPVPAAGFGAVVEPTSAPSGVRIPGSRDLAGVDTCRLVRPEDLAQSGGLSGTPQHRAAAFPESCTFPLGAGASGDLVLVAFYKPFDQVRRDQPKGREETTMGHSTWVYCGVSDGYRTCVAAVAVRPDRSLVVAMDKRDAAEDKVLGLLQTITETVLARLPRA